jgi:hypothetical protein
MEMFEKASREKFRFETNKGNLTVEDLWDLPLTSRSGPSLDNIAQSLHKKMKDNEEVSFVVKSTKPKNSYEDKFNVVKHIIDIRLAEHDAALTAKANKDRKNRILELIAKKKDEADMGKSIEELTALAESL